MEIDVVYKIPDLNVWENIKQYVRPHSVDLAVYFTDADLFATKKTIWNATGRISTGGIFFVLCEPENVSDVIRIVAEKSYKYNTVHIQVCKSMFIAVIVYKNEISKPKCDKLLRINSEDELYNFIINFSNYGETILFLDSGSLSAGQRAKQMGRNIIGFGNNEVASLVLHYEGVREIEI